MIKKSSLCCLNNYQPHIMKCLKRLVIKYIKSSLPTTLGPFQYAYYPNHSTEEAISTTTHLSPNYVSILFTVWACCTEQSWTCLLDFSCLDLLVNWSLWTRVCWCWMLSWSWWTAFQHKSPGCPCGMKLGGWHKIWWHSFARLHTV